MANTNIKTRLAALPFDTTVINITIPGESRLPTGCIIKCSFADFTSLGDANGVLPIFNGSYCIGFTDFTLVSTVSNSCLAESQPIANSQAHDDTSGDIVRILDPGGITTVRTASVIPVAGGIAVTPGESGDDFIMQITLIFGAECKAYSEGGSVNNGQDTVIAHGLSGKPECGFIGGGSTFQGNITNRSQVSWGLFSDDGVIKQHSLSQRSNDSNRSVVRGHFTDTRVFVAINDTGALIYTLELTGNDATNTTFTLRDGNAGSIVITGLLVFMGDVAANLQILDTPIVSNENWIHNSAGFVPQYACGLISLATQEGTIPAGFADTMGITEFDNVDIDSTILYSIRHNINPAQTYSLASDGLIWATGGAGISASAYKVSLISGGFQINALDIQLMDPVSRRFPVLFIEDAASTNPDPTLSNPTAVAIGVSQAQGTVDTDATNGIMYGVITQSAVTPSHAQIVAGLDDVGAAADSSNAVPAIATTIMNFFGLSTGNTYFAHFTQTSSGSSESNQVTSASFQTSVINQSPVIVGPIPDQAVVVNQAYNFDISGFFSDPDGDPLTYTGVNMPTGLSMNSLTGIISGVPTGGGIKF